MKKEALLYKSGENKSLVCFLCSHKCNIPDGKFGFCGVRQNLEGKLYTYAFGEVIAAQVDPVEKKPLYHFLPGTTSFSVATIGCNFRCGFCQNWEISQRSFKDQVSLKGESLSPQEIVQLALKNNCQSISYTYTEPTIFFEYAFETARIAKAKGLKNIFVTNGYMSEECLEMIKPYLDAANVDLKFFKDSSYKKICAGQLDPVLRSIIKMRELGIWVEVTTLILPGVNDSDDELKNIAGFISKVGKNIPWHISRFHPDYNFNTFPATPEPTLKKAKNIGKEAGLEFIYVGNIPGLGEDTKCPACKRPVIKREFFDILEYNIKDSKCAFCSALIPGVFI